MNSNFQRIGAAIDQHAHMLNEHELFIQKENARQLLEAEKEIVSYTIEKARLYNQGIMFAGYAGFFAFWGFMKDKMLDWAFVASGFLMAISLAIFIFYTVWQNIQMNRLILMRTRAINEAENDPTKLLGAKEEFNMKMKNWTRNSFFVWNIVLLLTVVPALVSVGILFFAFGTFLFYQL